MKKYIGIILCIILLISGFSFFLYQCQSKESLANQIYQDNKNDVDKAVEKLMNHHEFKKMDDKRQVNAMEELLKLYQKNKKIKNLLYDDTNMTFTFEYQNGILGGVRLKDFDPMLN